ncbi:transaldolase [Phlyctema vagabunda]|uniref:Transaldolase n=1 Tax=Phlyctema vagabunda TaxID=108571 RepID=A0ABR4P3P8_9HELO
MQSTINSLVYLRTKTQVDCDSLDFRVVENYGPFVDCTSNQAECYFQFIAPERTDLIRQSIAYAREIHHEFPGVEFKAFAVELCMVTVNLTAIPHISGCIHIMANPTLSNSVQKTVENAKRIIELCQRWNPNIDPSRICIKIPATWEGLQACRELKSAGIKTLATTLFTIEQAMLAAEVGCVSISPFIHELKVHFDTTYKDKDPIFGLCVEAQRYFQKYSYQTSVKACSLISIDEVMMVAGVASVTIPADLLQALQVGEGSEENFKQLSLFSGSSEDGIDNIEKITFGNNRSKFDRAFSQNDNGKGKIKTTQAVELFCEYQFKSEALMGSLTEAGY